MTGGLEAASMRKIQAAANQREGTTTLKLESKPGDVWKYHSQAYRLLFSVLEESTGKPLQEYSKEKLFDPLGFGPSRWRTRRGNTQFIEANSRDAARFGLFVLRGGIWNDKR